MESRTDKPARPYHHGRLREALIQAMLDLLKADPAEAISMREVARRAGVSHAAPRHHFADREQLVDEVAVRGMDQLVNVVVCAIDGEATSSAQLNSLGNAYMSFALENRNLFHLVTRRDHTRSPQVDAAISRLRDKGLARLQEVVERGQVDGHLAPGDPRAATNALWGLVHGLANLVTNQLLTVVEAAEAFSSFIDLGADDTRPWVEAFRYGAGPDPANPGPTGPAAAGPPPATGRPPGGAEVTAAGGRAHRLD